MAAEIIINPPRQVKRRYLLLFLLILFCHMATPVAAEPTPLQAFLQKIQDKSDPVRSFSSEFNQEKNLALFSQPVFFQGKLAIIRPDKLRWAFTSPVASVLIFEGNQGIRCHEDAPPQRFQLSQDPVMKIVAQQLWRWLGGDYQQLNQLYKLKKQGAATLLIRPRDQMTSEYILEIAITFNEESLQPQQVEIREPEGDITRIQFYNTQLNTELPATHFSHCNSNG